MSNEIITHKFRELLLPSILIAMALNITAIIDSSFVATFIGHNGQAALQVLEPLILLITILFLICTDELEIIQILILLKLKHLV